MKVRLAKKMRANPTKAEEVLWAALKDDFGGLKWATQVLMCGYILDFYAPEVGLAVEVDGSSHRGRELYDRDRDHNLLYGAGVKTLRLTNAEVLKNRPRALRKVLEAIPDA
jgi:very-short-patch-repair endonuclease